MAFSQQQSQRAATQVEAKVSALTAASILDLPRSDEAAVSNPEATSAPAPPPVSEQAVFTPPPPPAPKPAVVAPPAPSPVAVVVAPVTADQLHTQGRALLAQRKFPEAVEVLTQAISSRPNFALALNARGFAYLMLKKAEPALADLNKAIQLDPKYVNAYRNRSIAFNMTGQRQLSDQDRETLQRLLQPAAAAPPPHP